MPITTTDIGNRTLQLLGTRSSITSLTELSNEAQALDLCFAPIQNWCFGIANWNFARTTSKLSQEFGSPGSNPGTWLVASMPPPPWLFQWSLPDNYIRAIYLTNQDPAPVAGYLGEPKRFVIAKNFQNGTICLLTNEPVPILTYTALITDPTLWPWYFERLMVYALACTICESLTGDKKLGDELSQKLEQQISISMQMNTMEGLIIDDSTPEWIQALGINYPFRRLGTPSSSAPTQRTRNSGDGQ